MKTLRFAHLSDSHLPAGQPGGTLAKALAAGCDPQRALALCLEQLAAEPPDFLLLTGDLVHEGAARDYAALRARLERALPGVPVAAALGNHDRRAAFRQGFLGLAGEDDGPYYAEAMVDGLRLLSLDSAHAFGMQGALEEEQLCWLQERLAAPAPRGTALLFHHPIMQRVGPMGLPLCPRLRAALAGGEVRAIFNGHIHGAFAGTVCGVPQFTAESLGFGITLVGDRQRYNDRAAYSLGWWGEEELWVSQRLVRPEEKVFLEKPIR